MSQSFSRSQGHQQGNKARVRRLLRYYTGFLWATGLAIALKSPAHTVLYDAGDDAAGVPRSNRLIPPRSSANLSGPMVTIPGGTFQMGDTLGEGQPKERPAHEVTIKPFRLGKFEVTVGQFRRFTSAAHYRTDAEQDPKKTGCVTVDINSGDSDTWVRAGYSWRNPGYKQTDNYPVACVSWKDAQAYIAWLNEKGDGRFRLPTEAEYEYSARAGSTTKFPWGSDPNGACEYANGADQTPWPNGTGHWKKRVECIDHYFYAAPVGTYKPNAFGLYDMVGNVWEWVQDCWHDSYIGAPTDGSAWQEAGCPYRVSRGGSWHSSLGLTVSGREWSNSTSDRFGNQGFRLAQEP